MYTEHKPGGTEAFSLSFGSTIERKLEENSTNWTTEQKGPYAMPSIFPMLHISTCNRASLIVLIGMGETFKSQTMMGFTSYGQYFELCSNVVAF